MSRNKLREAELYPPVQHFFKQRGYTVRGEVLNCDLLAFDEQDTTHVVELKTSCNLTVILQAIARMSTAHYVSIAVPTPKRKQLPYWRELMKLCEWTGLGLLTVTFMQSGAFVTEHVPARLQTVSRGSSKRRDKWLKEAKARIGDFNVGGTNHTKRITAYRQLALLCAAEIATFGPRSPKQLRERLLNDKAGAILQANVYQWFVRVQRGSYDLSESGKIALIEYEHVLRELQSFEYNKNIES